MKDWNAIVKGLTEEELGALAGAVEDAKFSRYHEQGLGKAIVNQSLTQQAVGQPAQVDPTALIQALLQSRGEHGIALGMRGQENLTGVYPMQETVDSYTKNPLASPWQPGEMRQTVRDIRSRKP